MGKIYVLSSIDLPNHAVIFENKEVVNLSEIKKIVGFENLEIEYEADFNGFPISEYKGYLGFDDSTNDLLSINQPEQYIGYLNSNFSEYKTNISSFIFNVSTEEASIKIANDYYNNYSVSKRLSSKINRVIKKKNEEQSNWHDWLSLMKEKGGDEVKRLDDTFWKKFTADSEIKIKEFYQKNPYIKLKKPTGLKGFLMKINIGEEKKFRQIDDDNWKSYVFKSRNFFTSLIPDDENLSKIKLPCLYCRNEILNYDLKFYDYKNDVIIDGIKLEDISTIVNVIIAYCPTCEENSEISLNLKTQIFPKSNLSRWNSIWWDRFRFWGGY